jgi:hypothetical protein
MVRVTLMLLGSLAVSAGLLAAGDERKDRDRAQKRLQNLEARARKILRPAMADETSAFLARETQRLIERTKNLDRSSYEFARMIEAVDDLLDAREDLQSAQSDEEKDERREDSAKRLERAYFRVQQGDYFARLSADKTASEYVLRSRQLYQRGRSAYDRKEYRRANELASASGELVNVLENLAQAAVRRPEPPVLK